MLGGTFIMNMHLLRVNTAHVMFWCSDPNTKITLYFHSSSVYIFQLL